MKRDSGSITQTWMPSATKDILKKRALLMAAIREFFSQRKVLEVDTPLLASTSVTDCNIESITAEVNSSISYLQTSPEYFMKRLLAAGVGDIYCLGKVFRDAEDGPRHNPEFTMLEWYRLNWDEYQLMAEVAELITHLYLCLERPVPDVSHLSYADCFEQVFNINPHSCPLSELQNLAVEVGSDSWGHESRANCLDLLFSERVESNLPRGLVFVYDYPVCQAALSQTKQTDNGHWVSRRFEAFVEGMELANGYFELTDAKELRQRFEADNNLRSSMHKKQMPIDEHFQSAMQSGLPNCSGIALGVDRLLMVLCAKDTIESVIPFSWKRC